MPSMERSAETSFSYHRFALYNGRELFCSLRVLEGIPNVSICIYERDAVHGVLAPQCLNVSISEYMKLRSVLENFINYLLWECGGENTLCRPGIMVVAGGGHALGQGSRLTVDVSESGLWMLIRKQPYYTEANLAPDDKDIYFPTFMALHVRDLHVFEDVMKMINIFFTGEKERRKIQLLTARLDQL